MDAIWSFFAPEPGPPPVFLEYEALDSSGAQISRGYWPQLKSPYFWRERQNRRISLARFMTSKPERARRLGGEFICRKSPGAHSIRLWSTMYTVSALPQVASGEASLKNDTIQTRTWIGEQVCGGQDP
jgi:hypothetical protein